MTALLGRIRLRAGAALGEPAGARVPTLQRDAGPDIAGTLARGRPAEALPALMASVHALCAEGHRLAATLAVRAALGEHAEADGVAREALRRAVLRDHLLRMVHDWPRLLPTGGGAMLPLAGVPLRLAGGSDDGVAALPAWLSTHWLHRPVPEMLAALNDDPARAAVRWAQCAGTPLAQLLARELPPALALRTPERALRASVSPPVSLPTPTQAPAAAVPDTGPWSRHHDPRPAHNAGMRLIARLTDLLRLALPDGAERLFVHARRGEAAAASAERIGRAWVEVGRGLLGYEVRLGEASDEASSAAFVVRGLRIASPTDRNFHPAGVLAEALADVAQADDVRRLAVAFDPCVPFEVLTPVAEAVHA